MIVGLKINPVPKSATLLSMKEDHLENHADFFFFDERRYYCYFSTTSHPIRLELLHGLEFSVQTDAVQPIHSLLFIFAMWDIQKSFGCFCKVKRKIFCWTSQLWISNCAAQISWRQIDNSQDQTHFQPTQNH